MKILEEKTKVIESLIKYNGYCYKRVVDASNDGIWFSEYANGRFGWVEDWKLRKELENEYQKLIGNPC